MSVYSKDGFKFLEQEGAPDLLVVESQKLNNAIRYIKKNDFNRIMINPYMGFISVDISFLSELSDLIEALYIPDCSVFDLEVIHSLGNLKELGVGLHKDQMIDLERFPNLKELACEYTTKLKNLDKCKNLTSLSLTGFKSKTNDLSDLSGLMNIAELHLYKSSITSLKGAEYFNSLKTLHMFSASKLIDISMLQSQNDYLEDLEIDRCKKIESYEVLDSLTNLKRLMIADSANLSNLEFVKKLKKLDFLSFYGTNVIDGDLSHCIGISKVGFDDKRHYSHKFKELNPNFNLK